MPRSILSRFLLASCLFAPVSVLAQVPIIQPGAPGETARELSAEEAIEIAKNSYSPDDVLFMQDMIPHHNQAVQMAALVADRTNNPELIDIAGKIDASQADEIEFMQAMDAYKRASGRMFPTCSEILEVIRNLGYVKVSGPKPEAEETEAEIPEDFDQPHRVRHQLTVREPEVTMERLGEFERIKHPKYVALENRGFRWSTVGNLEQSYSPETNVLHIKGPPQPGGVLRGYQWMFEWCCGYGIAKWMHTIDSIHGEDGSLAIN